VLRSTGGLHVLHLVHASEQDVSLSRWLCQACGEWRGEDNLLPEVQGLGVGEEDSARGCAEGL